MVGSETPYPLVLIYPFWHDGPLVGREQSMLGTGPQPGGASVREAGKEAATSNEKTISWLRQCSGSAFRRSNTIGAQVDRVKMVSWKGCDLASRQEGQNFSNIFFNPLRMMEFQVVLETISDLYRTISNILSSFYTILSHFRRF